jgi:hypothetical protein
LTQKSLVFTPEGSDATQMFFVLSNKVHPVTCAPPVRIGVVPGAASQVTEYPFVAESEPVKFNVDESRYVPPAN